VAKGDRTIKDVNLTKINYTELQPEFETRSGRLADEVGLGASFKYLNTLDLQAAGLHESALLAMATDALLDIPSCYIFSQAPQKAEGLSFNIDSFSAQKIAEGLNAGGIAIISGHHCTQIILHIFSVEKS